MYLRFLHQHSLGGRNGGGSGSGSRGLISWRDNWARGCDFNGNDLTHVNVLADQCGPECDSTEHCTHFVWTNRNGGSCWMKTGAVDKSDAIPVRNQNRICGVASGDETCHGPISWRENWAHGCDFPGNDLFDVKVPADQCGLECDADEDCTHFVWTNRDGGTCWMKTGTVSKNDAIRKCNQNKICGVKD